MPAPQGQQGGGDHSAAMLWGIAAFFATLGGVWYVFKAQIVYFYLTVKLFELYALEYIGDIFNHAFNIQALQQSIEHGRTLAATISFTDLVSLGDQVGTYWRLPLVALLILLAVIVYTGSTARVFRRTYNMKEFAKLESKNWPQITPVINLDLLKADIDVGPWAMSMTPMQFCKKYNLLEEVRVIRQEAVNRKDRDKIEVVLKRGEANRIFVMQLGALWPGVNKLPRYMQALFAVFAARINANSKAAADLLAQMSASSLKKDMDFNGVDELLKKYLNTKLVQAVVKNHAYVMTVMASMLLASREDGVQASCDFLWLKPRDRRLWYTLNTVGRQTPFSEVAGIYAHWLAEKEACRRLMVPMVEEATNALELALKEVVYKPDEQ